MESGHCLNSTMHDLFALECTYSCKHFCIFLNCTMGALYVFVCKCSWITTKCDCFSWWSYICMHDLLLALFHEGPLTNFLVGIRWFQTCFIDTCSMSSVTHFLQFGRVLLRSAQNWCEVTFCITIIFLSAEDTRNRLVSVSVIKSLCIQPTAPEK